MHENTRHRPKGRLKIEWWCLACQKPLEIRMLYQVLLLYLGSDSNAGLLLALEMIYTAKFWVL
jgi:hypothetical protein